ncbi:MAG TPA: class I SAM-dependent methyltransferase [Bacteroidales bacterium]|nr:class I SAM-dependent methyltransferase [Bacteroidales bacterium]HSA44318.1 class I SAM-dependent methyltransferase [Bacteroidales bacterium]
METPAIPQATWQVTNGRTNAMKYLRLQKIMLKFYYNDFFSKFDQIARRGRYLEVGPGPACLTHLVCSRYSPDEIVGLDCSADMIRVAEQYIREKGNTEKISFVRGSVEDAALLQSLGTFDVIYSTFSLHDWSDPLSAIHNLYHALAPGGTMFIYDFNKGGVLYYLCLNKGFLESVRTSYRNDEIIGFLNQLGIRNYLIRKNGISLDFFIRKETIPCIPEKRN